MNPGDGLILVYSLEREDRMMAFTYDGIENLETLMSYQEVARR